MKEEGEEEFEHAVSLTTRLPRADRLMVSVYVEPNTTLKKYGWPHKATPQSSLVEIPRVAEIEQCHNATLMDSRQRE